jgi:hypothetical protein
MKLRTNFGDISVSATDSKGGVVVIPVSIKGLEHGSVHQQLELLGARLDEARVRALRMLSKGETP